VTGHQPPDRGALVEQTLEQGFPLMVFPPALEAFFQQECVNDRLRHVTASGVAAVLLFGFMLVSDWLLTPETLGLAAAVRLGVFAPLVLGGLWVLRLVRHPLLTEWGVALAGMLAILLTGVVMLSADSRWALSRVVELNIIVVYTCSLARFWPAVAMAGWVVLVQAFLVFTLPDFTGVVNINASLLLLVVMSFTLFGNYTLERHERYAFLMAQRERSLQDALETSHAQLAHLATTDALTDVANRRSAEAFLAQTWEHARRRDLSVALIAIDVDHFKRYNDHHGHQAGDRCLRSVARALSSCSRRAGDQVARMGGEEFLLTMVDVDQRTAMAVAQRVRDVVRGLAVPHGAPGCGPVVTVSVGVITVRPALQASLADTMKQADEALYAAKGGGRNRVCTRLADGEMHCLDEVGVLPQGL
jgi:diguanylate cyclase (GGDEF)-like protein